MTADLGREAVYAAEIAAFDGTAYESLVPIADLRARAVAICDASWWPGGDIEVVAARSDARSSSTRQRRSASPVVRLAAPQMTAATLVHEFAHVLAGLDAGHGPVFRRAHIDLVQFSFGRRQADWLTDAYSAIGLAVGDRLWSAPPASPAVGGPIAL